MALLRIDHTPETIKVNLPLNIIVPDPPALRQTPLNARKVLYLLHGLSDDATAWQRYSSIETVAAQYGLVVVMPSAGRSFYADQLNGQLYYTYLTEELPHYLEGLLDLRPSRENTLIAGLSMGGYGAMKIALNYPQRFAAAASFSGALSLEILRLLAEDRRQPEFEYVFGDLSHLAGSEHDPAVWLQRLAASGAAVPQLYVACGRQDDLYPLSLQFKALCNAHGIDVDYDEDDAGHEWPFWDRQIQRFLGRVLGGRA